MKLFFIYLMVIEYFELREVCAVYNKDVTCVIDEGQEMVCKTTQRARRRSSSNIPSHDPYIPRENPLLYNCSLECSPATFTSMIQLTSPSLIIKSCFIEITQEDDYACETIRYNHFKNIDKILFLAKTIPDKTFYLVDCLVYVDGGRVCHRKESDSHAELVDTGTLVRPNETNALAQEEFICEEDQEKNVQCDLNPYVPFDNGLKLKEMMKFDDNVLLKTGTYVVELKRGCVESWCGYSGRISPTRRQYSYSPPGGKTYRCYTSGHDDQRVCKVISDPKEWLYNDRGYMKR